MTSMLTTLDALKDDLGITDTSSDAKLSKLIAQASSRIETYCKRTFGRHTVTDTFRWHFLDAGFYPSRDWIMPRGLLLTEPPVRAITSVTENGTLLTAADYELDDDGYLWRLTGEYRRAWTPPTIIVVYDAGYILPDDVGTDLPEDLERICLDLCAYAYHHQGRDPRLRSETIPGILEQTWAVGTGATVRRGLPSDIAQRLDNGWAFRQ